MKELRDLIDHHQLPKEFLHPLTLNPKTQGRGHVSAVDFNKVMVFAGTSPLVFLVIYDSGYSPTVGS